MRGRGRGALLAAVLAVALAGCRAGRPPWEGATFWVLAGNRDARRGEDLEATWSYRRALQALKRSALEGDRARVAYNLAGVYLSLGEVGAALRQMEQALEGADEELLFRASFNLGVLEYSLGRYSRAAASYVQALRLRPGSWPAKVNLELCLRRMQAAAGAPRPASSDPASAPRPRLPAGDREILNALQRREKMLWETGESPQGSQPDW